jgi:hypothetical protein
MRLPSPERFLSSTTSPPSRLSFGSPEIGTPALGQVHVLKVESLVVGQYRKKPPQPRRSGPYQQNLVRRVLIAARPEWASQFPGFDTMSRTEYWKQASPILNGNPETRLFADRLYKTAQRLYRSR